MFHLKLKEEQNEEGFTLIELLVVVIIIGILAAIAIPVFLNQRERAWNSAVQSDLRNAATAQETYFTDEASYTTDMGDLEDVGFNNSANVTFGTIDVTDNVYCMQASHDSAPADTVWSFNSTTGEPVSGACS